jgi:hypothetical protein
MASTVRGSLLVLALPLLAAGTGQAPAWSAPKPSASAPAAAAPPSPPQGRPGSAQAGAPGTDPPVVFWEPVDPNAPPPPKTRPPEEAIAPSGLPRPGAVSGGGSQRIPALTSPPPGVSAGMPMPPPPGAMPAGVLPPGALPPGVRPPGPPGAMPPGMMPPPAMRQSRPPLAAGGPLPPLPPLPPGPPPPLQQAPKPTATTSLGPAAWLVPLLVLGGGAGTFVALRLRQRRGPL